jgi:hypothetical protein
MRNGAGFLLVCAALALTAAPARAQVPRLLEVPANALEPQRTQLHAVRQVLLTRLAKYQQEGRAFNGACGSVEKGSPAAQRCRQRWGELEGRRLQYAADADAFNARVRAAPVGSSSPFRVPGCPEGREAEYTDGKLSCVCPWGTRSEAGQCAPIPAKDMVATAIPFVVREMRGDVTFSLAGVSGEVTLPPPRAGLTMRANTVTTGPRSRVELLLPDQTVFTVGPNTRMTLDKFVYDERQNPRDLSAELTKGVFRFVTAKVAGEDPAAWAVRVPSGCICIRGTDFMVEALGEGRFGVSLMSGRIELRPRAGGAPVVVQLGERVVVDASMKLLSRATDGAAALQRRWAERVR